ncbi:carbonic anhydrase 1-like isoform X2 [Biomphalaria glabrata]|uniref:Carbonic anhydrase n=1 Tax=Biomphalaria glabrata TaxID=6526 RepID=A0A9W2YHW9_BIOGL|nr:carbonic anhydrase 1-like isoform X2 [Biomphalaria glabrata]
MLPADVSSLFRCVCMVGYVCLLTICPVQASMEYNPASDGPGRLIKYIPFRRHSSYPRNQPTLPRVLVRTSGTLSTARTRLDKVRELKLVHPIRIQTLPSRNSLPRNDNRNRFLSRLLNVKNERPLAEQSVLRPVQHRYDPLSEQGKKFNIWSYDDSDSLKVGPRVWPQAFPNCGHRYQSPIDIMATHFQYRPMSPIALTSVDHTGLSDVVFSNDGFTATIKPLHKNIYIDCEDMPGRFILSGIHFHWGRTDHIGSEHLLDGHAFPLEMHLVAYNSEFPSLGEAEGKENGVHTVAIFFEVSDIPNQGLNFCVENFKNIQRPGADVKGEHFNISQLFPPPGQPYFRYLGSLTTPPCTENVIWSVFAVPQVISLHQLSRFRTLGMSTELNPYIGGNVRPLQPIDNRIIYTNDVIYKK